MKQNLTHMEEWEVVDFFKVSPQSNLVLKCNTLEKIITIVLFAIYVYMYIHQNVC